MWIESGIFSINQPRTTYTLSEKVELHKKSISNDSLRKRKLEQEP